MIQTAGRKERRMHPLPLVILWTMKLYDRTSDVVTLDEVEWIVLRGTRSVST